MSALSTPRTAVRGAGAGLAAALLGYVATWITAGREATRLTVGGPFGGSVPDWRAVLWLCYDSHSVGTRTPEVFGPGGDLWGGGELVDTVGLLGVEFLYAVPVAVLLLAGVAVASAAGVADLRAGVVTGLAVAVGYLPAVVGGLFLASQGGVAPSPLRAVVVAGLVYPVAFGAAGGALAALVTGRE